MLDSQVADLAFYLVIGDMVFMNEVHIFETVDFGNFRMAGTTAFFGNYAITHLHITMTFLALNLVLFHKGMIVFYIGLVLCGNWCFMALSTIIDRFGDRRLFKMT